MVTFKDMIPPAIAAAGFSAGDVYVDTELTREIESEGYSREVIRRIQDMRKELDLAVEEEIRHAREDYHRIEEVYISGMTELLQTNDAMYALRKREIYHHLRDAGRAMRDTLDILHNAVIDLA